MFIFYLKLLATGCWFAVSIVVTFFISLMRWRNPSNPRVFAKIFGPIGSKINGFKIEVRNAHRLIENQPCIYLANHQSNIDLLVYSFVCPPRTVIIGKRELWLIPGFGLIFYVTGNIMINRKNRSNSMEGFREALDFITQKGGSIFVFPEGTRNSSTTTLLPFKKGAFHLAIQAQIPLVPVVAGPITKIVNLKKRQIFKNTLPIEVLEPIPTKGKTAADMEDLIATARSRMQNAFASLGNPD
jgi:1-acyl-sn-glycerol-3-phosphate acyltransferase